jgi:hypothetical protein
LLQFIKVFFLYGVWCVCCVSANPVLLALLAGQRSFNEQKDSTDACNSYFTTVGEYGMRLCFVHLLLHHARTAAGWILVAILALAALCLIAFVYFICKQTYQKMKDSGHSDAHDIVRIQ